MHTNTNTAQPAFEPETYHNPEKGVLPLVLKQADQKTTGCNEESELYLK